jgi:hypothetical protein
MSERLLRHAQKEHPAGQRLLLLLLPYTKRVQAQEMIARFGDAYLAYRRQTPFSLPRVALPGSNLPARHAIESPYA